MARKKTPKSRKTVKKTPKAQPQRQTRWGVVFGTLVVIAVVIPLAILWDSITAWVGDTASSIWDALGWGILFVILFIVTPLVLLRTQRLYLFVRRWNQWLGGIAIIVAAWGILGLAEAGGSVGTGIIGKSGLGGHLRIAGLVVAGIILIFPEVGYHIIVKPIQWWRNRPKRPVITQTRQKKETPTITPTPTVKPAPPTTRPTTPTLTPPEPQRGLRQVAADVWKRYGEPASVTVDGWRLPPIDILDKATDIEFSEADNMRRAELIEEALLSQAPGGLQDGILLSPFRYSFGPLCYLRCEAQQRYPWPKSFPFGRFRAISPCLHSLPFPEQISGEGSSFSV